jgi:hypothetical protein
MAMMPGGGVIVNVRVAKAVCGGEPESVILKVRGVAATGAVGVPLMTPVWA